MNSLIAFVKLYASYCQPPKFRVDSVLRSNHITIYKLTEECKLKKSLLAMLCVLFGLFAVPLAYADEMATDDAGATMQEDEPLPPMMDESGS